jgi:hypothetical protein
MKWSLTFAVYSIPIRTVLQKEFCNILVAVFTGLMKRSLTFAIDSMPIRTML